ncbi:SPASM domain-containing protein [Candidatus Woesearchaeota archaeon]|nr:SPASM domain-containing protein [Candidatus Woesearchaeota archaeon]MBT5399714.1 SPASM domain-containing protein [bacterium]
MVIRNHLFIKFHSYNGKINLGNVNEQSIYDIWNGKKIP